jgi:hypothetical protein
MKWRTKKALRNRLVTNRLRAPNVLRHDPSRTGPIVNHLITLIDNVFCATGPGGGVDPTCSPGSDAIAAFVSDSKRVTPAQRGVLTTAVAKSTTSRSVLHRVSKSSPGWKPGDVVDLDPTSFTGVDVTTGKSAGQIGWKSNDHGLVTIESPHRGLDVDYSKLAGAETTPRSKRRSSPDGIGSRKFVR